MREFPYRVEVFWKWFDLSFSDPKSSEVYFPLAELEFFWVEGDSRTTKQLEVVDDTPPVLFKAVVPECGVVYTFCFTRCVGYDPIISICVSITTANKALWGYAIAEESKFSRKGEQVTVLLAQ